MMGLLTILLLSGWAFDHGAFDHGDFDLWLLSDRAFDRIPWFRHEKVDNQMYCVVCLMFGIANKNHVKTWIKYMLLYLG